MKTLFAVSVAVIGIAVCTATARPSEIGCCAYQPTVLEIDSMMASDLDALQPARSVTVMTSAQWNDYSDVLEDALKSSIEGLKFAALRLVIQYQGYVTLSRSGIHEMAAMYRNHRNDNVRRMAVVALASTEDPWAIDYLKRSVKFEKTPKVLHTLKAVLQPQIIVGEPERIQ